MVRCVAVFFLCASLVGAENELFTLTLVTRDGRVPERTRGLIARKLPGVDVKSTTAMARYRQSPKSVEASCLQTAYFLHDAAGALIGRGCVSDIDLAATIFTLRGEIRRNQALYSQKNKNPVALLDQALAAAAQANYGHAAAILERPEMTGLPLAEQAIARRLRKVLSR